ncbi:phosphoribosylformylglycinamidine synthase I [Candidatus Roizmanbacteria bacterium]|nr:phosphoribosylformylglycinamidine synthase I [Candidatus Roizmanbacteria bacterium]
MKKPKTLIFSGYGLNSEEETRYAFELAGSDAEIVHINDLIASPKKLDSYQIISFPGGFSYGDDTGSGNGFANRIRNYLWEEIKSFVQKDKLVLGICNGFQILTNLGLLPALNEDYGKREVALLQNTSARYSNRWVDIEVQNDSPWLKKLTRLSLPIAHGEGRFFATEKVLTQLKKKNLIAFKYIPGEITTYLSLPYNPNGALADIAGITDESKRILGMMPHPERGMFFTQLPHWTMLKLQYQKDKLPLPEFAQGLQIFNNGVSYFL